MTSITADSKGVGQAIPLPELLKGQIEPHGLILRQPEDGQRLFKVMRAEHLLQSIAGGYLHFNRVDAYRDFPGADPQDGAELPSDQPANGAATFERAPDVSLSDYYARSRGRTYACCFSLENSEHIWSAYGRGSAMGQAALEFDLGRLRERLNATLSGQAALMCGDLQCHQIFSINYGIVDYVSRATHRANTERAANPITYAYLKDEAFAGERELRITLSATGMGQFILDDGRFLAFPPSLQLGFDYRAAIADGTIAQILTAPDTDEDDVVAALAKLGIGLAR